MRANVMLAHAMICHQSMQSSNPRTQIFLVFFTCRLRDFFFPKLINSFESNDNERFSSFHSDKLNCNIITALLNFQHTEHSDNLMRIDGTHHDGGFDSLNIFFDLFLPEDNMHSQTLYTNWNWVAFRPTVLMLSNSLLIQCFSDFQILDLQSQVTLFHALNL